MKSLHVLALLLAVSLPSVALAQAGTKADPRTAVVGNWEGSLKAAPGIEVRIRLDVTRAKDGSLSGKLASPDEGLSDLPLAAIALEGDVFTFDLKITGATYKGTLNRPGTQITGHWTQRGKTLPLVFARFDASKRAVVPVPKELEGIWLGTVKVPGGIELRVGLEVTKGKDGVFKATLASPDQGAKGIPIGSIGLKENVLTFESRIIGARYTGKKNKDGSAFEGELNQFGLHMPLVLKKTDKIKEATRPQTPKPPFPYSTVEVTYENKSGAVKLAGTLSVPRGNGPFPAVLLISGSGAQDRDETIMGHKPFLVLADYLTRHGVAVLRVDDRGVGGSTGSIASSTSEDFAGDVLAGVALLKERREIDPRKIGLIGHSEGGIIAPIAAVRSRDVAFIVLMAGTGLPGSEILEAQAELILKATGTSEPILKLQRKTQRRLIEIVSQEKDEKARSAQLAAALKAAHDALPESERKALGAAESTLSELAVNQMNNAWFRFFLAFDPRPTLRKVRCPVLAINGEKDLQVPSKQNLAEIGKALAEGGNQHVKTVELPGLNHLFQPCKTGAPTEYSAIETTIAPEVLRTISDWIAEQTTTTQ
jgi:pimeloyl-ACP methyl ester carboxylesterase